MKIKLPTYDFSSSSNYNRVNEYALTEEISHLCSDGDYPGRTGMMLGRLIDVLGEKEILSKEEIINIVYGYSKDCELEREISLSSPSVKS